MRPVEAVDAGLEPNEVVAQVGDVNTSAGDLALKRAETVLYLAQVLAHGVHLFIEAA
jgi:hypothetical protein